MARNSSKRHAWQVQGYTFHTDLKVLPLPCYDMVLWMDWLSAFSPMRVDLANKWLSIPYARDHVLLQGELPSTPANTVVQIILVQECNSPKDQEVTLPPTIMELLQEYSGLFEEPKDLPPSRGCDHSIPLVPGATRVSVRPYRCPPALEDEIEK